MVYALLKKKTTRSNVNASNIVLTKLGVLVTSFIIFALIYYFLCKDSEFSGINLLQDELSSSLVKTFLEKVKKNELSYSSVKEIGEQIKEGDIDPTEDSGEDTRREKQAKEELDPETTKITKSVTEKHPLQQFYDRLYFSVVTGTTIGYGDIYPQSNKVKFICMLQVFTTIAILIS